MSDDDLIRRGDALKLMQLAIDVYGQNMRGAADKKEKRDWQSMLIAAVDIRYAIKAIPAVQVTAYSENDVAALVEALEWAMSHVSSLPMDEASQSEFLQHRATFARVKGGAA